MTVVPKSVTETKPNVHLLEFDGGKTLYLIGTAHVSEASVALVGEVIGEVKPDTVSVELDEDRLRALDQPNQFENFDIIKILRTGQGFYFIGHLLLASFQKKISDRTGTKPGDELRRAVTLARESGARLVLADRSIRVTLKRAWNKTGFWGQTKLLGSLFGGEGEDKLKPEDIEALKEKDALTSMMEDLGRELPATKRVLIDERDTFLVAKIRAQLGQKTVAVVGAGHVPGMLQNFSREISDDEIAEMEKIPTTSWIWKLIPWLFPAILIGLFAGGLFFGKFHFTVQAIGLWLAANMGMTALGSIIALAHPVTIILGALAAPFTALHPAIGVGMVTGIVEAFFRKPRVIDFVNVQESASTLKGWYQNRLTRIFLVFILSSLGATLSNIVVLPILIKWFSS